MATSEGGGRMGSACRWSGQGQYCVIMVYQSSPVADNLVVVVVVVRWRQEKKWQWSLIRYWRKMLNVLIITATKQRQSFNVLSRLFYTLLQSKQTVLDWRQNFKRCPENIEKMWKLNIFLGVFSIWNLFFCWIRLNVVIHFMHNMFPKK